jgi:CHAD domain-containing protein
MPAWRVERIVKNLKFIRRAANDARDADVFASRLAQDKSEAGVGPLLNQVSAHRRRVQEPIVAAYRKLGKSGKFAQRVVKLLNRVGTGRRTEAGTVRFGDWALCRLQAESEAFFKLAAEDLSDVHSLHQLRIAAKNLRYTIELLSAGLPDAVRSTVYPMLADLQGRLGTINDHATAQQQLARWMQEQQSDAEQVYLRTRLEAEQAATESLRQEFLDWWNGTRAAELQQAYAEAVEACQPV